MQIEAVSSISDLRVDYRIVVAGKDIDALVRDIVRVVDVAAARPFIGLLEKRFEGGRRPFHAGTGRDQGGAEIAQKTLCRGALCTIIRPAGDDADPFDYR